MTTIGRERGKKIFGKIWERKDHKKAEWIHNMETELHILEKGPKVEIHLEALKATLKIYKTGKSLA